MTAGGGGMEQEGMEERLARVEEQLAEVLARLTRVEIRVGDLGQQVAYLEAYIVVANLFIPVEMGLRRGTHRCILRLPPASHEESRRCVFYATSSIG